MGFWPADSAPDRVQSPSAVMARYCWAPDASTSTPRVAPLRSRAVARKLRTAAAARSGAGVRGFGVSMALNIPPDVTYHARPLWSSPGIGRQIGSTATASHNELDIAPAPAG